MEVWNGRNVEEEMERIWIWKIMELGIWKEWGEEILYRLGCERNSEW